MQTCKEEVTIIGAGLSGSLLATMLSDVGYQVKVYEARADMRKANISAGRSINLALSSRGIKALKAINIFAEIESSLVPMYGRELHLSDGTIKYQPYTKNGHDAIYSMSRGELNKILLDAAEKTKNVELKFNSPCREVNLENKEIIFADNSIEKFTNCIGADGFNSALRKSICDSNEVNVEKLGHQYKELTLPAKNNDYQLKKNALHIWPRGEYMLISLPNADGSFTMTLFLPEQGDYTFTSLNTKALVKDFFIKHFADVAKLLPDLEEQFFANPVGELATVRAEKWQQEKSVLIGDAAHAIVPFHGQGMNCAFEDCLLLYQLLKKENVDVAQAFNEFFVKRKPNADAIADLAIENYEEMRSKVRDEKFHLKKELAWHLKELYPQDFIPRYSMVMFYEIPYSVAKKLGEIQNNILDHLTEKMNFISDLDYRLASNLIENELTPHRKLLWIM